jgi:hypothetical protein
VLYLYIYLAVQVVTDVLCGVHIPSITLLHPAQIYSNRIHIRTYSHSYLVCSHHALSAHCVNALASQHNWAYIKQGKLETGGDRSLSIENTICVSGLCAR